MINFKHTAIYGTRLSMKSEFIRNLLKGKVDEHIFPELIGKMGLLYSYMTLENFIDEEVKHEFYDLLGKQNRSIRNYSSGEQKKILLEYLIKQNPDFLVVDNPFDALDVNSVQQLTNRLTTLSISLPIIQVFKRRNDLLPFIERAIDIEHEEVVFNGPIHDFLDKQYHSRTGAVKSIPPPLNPIHIEIEKLVEFKEVDVSYGEKPILKNINWTIKKGEFWQLKGPNGSGKTTLLTMINGDNPKAYGQDITLFGIKKGSGENVWQLKHFMGYFTPSMMDLFKGRHTAMQMVISGIVDSVGLYQKATESQKMLASEWLKLINVFDKKDLAFAKLSQIQQRLVLIARAMIKHPPLLILDEPSIGLDDEGVQTLTALINKIAEESSTAILYVSHRNESNLKPQFIFELALSDAGSTGKVLE